MEWQPNWPSHMEVSYCAFGFGGIIRRDLRILSLPHDSPCNNLLCMRDQSPLGKGNPRLTKLLGGPSCEKNPGVQLLPSIRDSKMATTTDSPFEFPWYRLFNQSISMTHPLGYHSCVQFWESTKMNIVKCVLFHCTQMFNIYIKRAAEIYGVTHTRSIYEQAIEVLNEEQAREMCIRFADLERKLGEIDRARAIYSHCSQMCDPRVSLFGECCVKLFKILSVLHIQDQYVRRT